MSTKTLRCAGPWFRAALLAAVLAGDLRAQEERDLDGRRIQAVVLEGVRAVDRTELARALATQPSRCRSFLVQPICWISDGGFAVDRRYLDTEELARDELRIRVFYWRRGYRDAQVATTVTESADVVDVEFTVTEGPATTIVERRIVRSDTVLSDAEVEGAGLPAEGQPLDVIAIDSAVLRLRGTLWQRAYGDAEVRDTAFVDDAANTAVLEVVIEPNARTTVEAIRIEGLEKVGEGTIRNSLALRPGDLFRRGDVVVSQRSLYESNLFRQALVDVPDGQDSAKVVEVTVREAPLRAAHTTVGFNTVDFIQTEAQYTNYNWFGGARRLDVIVTLGNLLAPQLNGSGLFRDVTPATLTAREEDVFLSPTWRASIDVTQPWFRDFRNSLGIGVFTHRRTVPGIVVDRGYGARASFTRRLARETPASLTYHFEVTRVEAGDIYYCVNFGVCDVATISALRNTQRMSPFGLTITSDRANDPIMPTGGYTWRLNAEHASTLTLSDFRYHRAAGEATAYFALGGGVLAARVRAGWVRALASTAVAVGGVLTDEEILHPRKRFYAGGSRSVRGYGENQLGPRILTIAPSLLTDTARANPCTEEDLLSGACDPNGIVSDEFQPRPLGGNTVLEGNLEYRLGLSERFGAVLFVDAGSVGEDGGNPFSGGHGAVTPGFGFRYQSPIGAVRVDLGIRPTLAEELPVVTQVTDPDGEVRIIRLETAKRYDPLEGASGMDKLFRRLALHLSIGQAF